MNIVEVNHLVKTYSGKTAVNDLSFSVIPGEILGLIGPNGAGKSTTIKAILGFIKPDSGNVEIFGGTMNDSIKNQLGYLPEDRGLYKKLPVIDLIVYLASLKGMDKHAAVEKADELLDKTGMLANRKMKIEEMSKGMGQMIQLIVTIIHEPKLIILDEPFSGLDPVNRALLKKILAGLRDEGRTIMLSTHEMNEVEEICNRILMINKGQAVLYGDLKEIQSAHKANSVIVSLEGDPGRLKGVIDKRINKDSVELILDDDTTPQNILNQLSGLGINVDLFKVATPSLNELFIKIAGGK